MFCHRIGRAFGVIDIDLIDDSMTDEMLLEFQAAAWIDGWYHGKTSQAEIIAEIRNLGERLIVSRLPRELPYKPKATTPHDIIDILTATKAKKSKTMINAKQAEQEAAKRYG